MTKSQLDEDQRQECKRIEERLKVISDQIGETCALCGRQPDEITVMAVTKTVAPVFVNHAVTAGNIKLLGENRAQELCEKYEDYFLKQDQIHFIGHLQTNKVRQIIDKVSMIQSVSSEKLAAEIEKQAALLAKPMDILLEVNIGREESKSGIFPEQLDELTKKIGAFSHLQLRGLMAIPPKENPDYFFAAMQEIYKNWQEKHHLQKADILSLGMSADYPIAIRHGSTLVRLGSAIFGPRNIAPK